MSDAYRKFSENVLIYVEDDYIVFETDNLPNHKSPYYNENNVLYEEYNGNNQNFNLNPNKILKQNIVMKVPADPKESKKKLLLHWVQLELLSMELFFIINMQAQIISH